MSLNPIIHSNFIKTEHFNLVINFAILITSPMEVISWTLNQFNWDLVDLI